jgi:hypothetical protein
MVGLGAVQESGPLFFVDREGAVLDLNPIVSPDVNSEVLPSGLCLRDRAMFSRMANILIPWVCASIAFCLAFLRVGPRKTPRMDEQMVAGCEHLLRPVVLEKAKTAYPPSAPRPLSPFSV